MNFLLQEDDVSCGPIAFLNHLRDKYDFTVTKKLMKQVCKKMQTDKEGTTTQNFILFFKQLGALSILKSGKPPGYSFIMEYAINNKGDMHFAYVTSISSTLWMITNHFDGHEYRHYTVLTSELTRILKRKKTWYYLPFFDMGLSFKGVKAQLDK